MISARGIELVLVYFFWDAPNVRSTNSVTNLDDVLHHSVAIDKVKAVYVKESSTEA